MSPKDADPASSHAAAGGEADSRLELERLRDEIRIRDEFLAMTAHELRNPLQSMAMQLAVARSLAETQGAAALTGRIAKIQTLLGRYVGRVTVLLDIASAEQSSLPASLETLDIAALLGEVAESLVAEGNFHGMAVRVLDQGPCLARSNRLMLEQILENLVINAFKHAAGSEVVLSVIAAGGQVQIRVADNGSGIAASDRERIFVRFSVAESSRRGTGSGLGLWIVRRLVERLGGTVSLLLSSAEGSTFQVVLPSANTKEVPS